MPKPKKPKPRNLVHRDMIESGAFKQRVVSRKDKDPKFQRRTSKRALRDPEKDA